MMARRDAMQGKRLHHLIERLRRRRNHGHTASRIDGYPSTIARTTQASSLSIFRPQLSTAFQWRRKTVAINQGDAVA